MQLGVTFVNDHKIAWVHIDPGSTTTITLEGDPTVYTFSNEFREQIEELVERLGLVKVGTSEYVNPHLVTSVVSSPIRKSARIYAGGMYESVHADTIGKLMETLHSLGIFQSMPVPEPPDEGEGIYTALESKKRGRK